MTLLATRLSKVQPSPTLALTARANALKAEGRDVINLGAGEPDFATPEWICEAAHQAMISGQTKYTAVEGTLNLRKAIQKKFLNQNGLTYGLDEIIVGTGGKQVLFNALMATINPGDEVIIPAPYWVSYPDMVQLFDGTPVIVTCAEKDHFRLTPETLEQAITPKTKWLILNSPSNPTGSVYSKEELEQLAQVLLKYPHVYVLSDDIYEHLLYDKKEFYTLAQVSPALKARILTVNGVSKAYSMTGWRIGYAGGPKPLIKAMTMVQSQSTSNASSISQAAALEALEGDQDFLEIWRGVFEKRRTQICEKLNAIPGLSCRLPEGAFYLYVSCEKLLGKKTPSGMALTNDQEVATYFLDYANVAVVHGEAFGLTPYFRISYATSLELLLEACRRIEEAVSHLS